MLPEYSLLLKRYLKQIVSCKIVGSFKVFYFEVSLQCNSMARELGLTKQSEGFDQVL